MANLVSDHKSGDPATSALDPSYTIEFGTPLLHAGSGQPAFAARSAQTGAGLMAVQIEWGWPVRATALTDLMAGPIAHMAAPVAHGTALVAPGSTGYFVICNAVPGTPVATGLQPWPERALLDLLLRPATMALSDLHARGITHRAIRLDNVFRATSADAVMLGCAWAAPPASRQPCVFEPPYTALCLPAGRGDGAPADDIYALGVLLVALALGQDPMQGMDDDAIIRAKLDLGSFEAITAHHRLPTAILELARGMLADDPEHRPSALLLRDPAAARARRAAARPQRRGQRSFPLGQPAPATARELALAIMQRPDLGAPQIRNGAVALWLRRSLGDGAMSGRIEDICGLREETFASDAARADSMLTARAVAVLDPLAPLAWRRLMIWPDGLGSALNQALQIDMEQALVLSEVAADEVPIELGKLRPERSNAVALETTARLMRTSLGIRHQEQGLLRLNYALNPLAPCESPLLAGQWVAQLGDLLPALEIAASGALRANLPAVDRFIVAFISARRDDHVASDLAQLTNLVTPGDAMTHLRVLARLQQHVHPKPLPGLAGWMAEAVKPVMGRFHSQTRRIKIAERMVELAKNGSLPSLVNLLDDGLAIDHDRSAFDAAIARGGAINAELEAIATSQTNRRMAAGKLGHSVTSGMSLAACGLALAAAAFL